jgi:hypothetical protein
LRLEGCPAQQEPPLALTRLALPPLELMSPALLPLVKPLVLSRLVLLRLE